MATTAKKANGRTGQRANVVSLERALSKLGLASRSQARDFIVHGRVSVDGKVIRNPALRVTPERIAVSLDGAAQTASARFTIALHKPRGYVTTRSDPEGRQTVYDLLQDVPVRVVPVGRLDRATSGLLILTSDTQLANWLTDPRSAVPRVYLVTVEGRLTPESMRQLEQGIVVDGDRLAAAAVQLRKGSARESHATVTLTEGKNREVRRLFEAIGHPVLRLRRVQFGGLALGDLAPGSWREIGDAELGRAFPAYQARRREPKPK